MVITPNDAAGLNDAAIEEELRDEEARIDEILKKEFYTGAPHVVVPAPRGMRNHILDLLKGRYNKAGWKIEVRQRIGEVMSDWLFKRA